jgi:alkylation response protein AidB-like acyl-CoA dehydrogenase
VFEVFRDQGLFSLPFDETEGGSGAGTAGLAIAVEEVARACATSAQILILAALSTWPLRLAGENSGFEETVKHMAAGNTRGAFALTEPNASSDIGSMVTRAEQGTNGGYVLSGEKDFVSGSPVADYFIVFAKTGRSTGDTGMSCFFVRVPQSGVIFLRRDEGMGIKGMPHCDWAFQDCEVAETDRVGAEGDGEQIARHSMNAIQPLLAARGLGAAEECLAFANDYALDRRIYGGHLADLPTVQLQLADIAINVEATRALTYRAARMVDEGRFLTESDAAYLNAAKIFSARTAVMATDRAMQIVGGHGYMEVHPLERMYRDARHLSLYMGTDEVLRLRIASAVVDGGLLYGQSVSRQPTEERALTE